MDHFILDKRNRKDSTQSKTEVNRQSKDLEGLGRVTEAQFEGMKLKAETSDRKVMFKMVDRKQTLGVLKAVQFLTGGVINCT